MVCNLITGVWTLSIVRNSNYQKTMFRKLICFRLQVRGDTPTLLDPLETANLSV
jgi:hypothetical protein